jgi:hypothetical protein
MKMQLLILVAFVVLAVYSCKNVDDVVGPSNNVKNPTFLFAPTNESLEEDDLFATFTVYKSHTYVNEWSSYSDFSGIDACFYNDNYDASVHAGNVTFNNWSVPSYFYYDSTSQDSIWAYGVNPYSASFNGGSKSWNVSGSSYYQSLSFNIMAPYYEVIISNLQPNQNISLSQGFTVQWNNNNQPTDGAKVIISQGNDIVYAKEASDNGSISFTPTELSSFSAGTADIFLATGNCVIVPLNQSSHYAFALYFTSHEIPINFQ